MQKVCSDFDDRLIVSGLKSLRSLHNSHRLQIGASGETDVSEFFSEKMQKKFVVFKKGCIFVA